MLSISGWETREPSHLVRPHFSQHLLMLHFFFKFRSVLKYERKTLPDNPKEMANSGKKITI